MQPPRHAFPSTLRIVLAVSLLALALAPALAQNNSGAQGGPTPAQQAAHQALREASLEDHRDMMKQLGIVRLCPGRNGSLNATNNPANYDSSRVNPYPDYPELLTLESGRKVTRAEKSWSLRRPEIVEDFERHQRAVPGIDYSTFVGAKGCCE